MSEQKSKCLPKEITHLIMDYLPFYRMNLFIFNYVARTDTERYIGMMCGNSHDGMLQYMEICGDLLDWYYLSKNSNDKAVDMIFDNLDKVDGDLLCLNTNSRVIEYLRNNLDVIGWDYLSSNESPDAVQLLIENKDNIDLSEFIKENKSPKAAEYIVKNLRLFRRDDLKYLSSNPNDIVIELLERRTELINWKLLSSNSNDKAVDLLLSNQDKIDWCELSKNSNDRAVDLLLDNLKKDCICGIVENSNDRIFRILWGNREQININHLLLNKHHHTLKLVETIYNERNENFDIDMDLVCDRPDLFEHVGDKRVFNALMSVRWRG